MRRWSWRSLLALAPALAAAEPAVITAEELLALRKDARLVVVDARTPAEFEAGHVPGAINLPPERVIPEAERLPRDREAPIVFYCRGPG